MRAARFLRAAIVAVCLGVWCIGAPYGFAGQKGATSVELVGRNGKFQVINRDGSVQNVDAGKLSVPTIVQTGSLPETSGSSMEQKNGENGADSSSGAAGSPGGANANSDGKASKPGASEDVKAPQVLPVASGAKPITRGEQAARDKDAESLRRLLKQGSGYFYGADNKPLSYEEVQKRIDKGDVAGITALDLHLQPWASHDVAEKEGKTYPTPVFPQLKSKTQPPAETSSP